MPAIAARGPCGHRKEPGSALGAGSEKKAMSHRGIEPEAVLRLACRSHALPTELSRSTEPFVRTDGIV